ncbi:MAG: helix-turn-helix domain-containing protein [Silvanigrellaceae bacterium]|nr:helix-turn-helix domain-containing protein [Silvanigrellaceae bacterium]
MSEQNLDDGRWMKLSEAASLLQISEVTLRRKIKTGKIPSNIREGRYYVFLNENESLKYNEQEHKDESIYKLEMEKKDQEMKELKRKILDQQLLIQMLEQELAECASS